MSQSPDAPDEAQALMLAFQRGDDAAFDRLVAICKDDVAALAYRYGLDATRCDDLTQEVFVRVWKSRALYRPEARFRAWLLRIATNLVISEARSRRRARAVPLERAVTAGNIEDEGSTTPLPEDKRIEPPGARMEREEVERAVEAAVAALPETQRVALMLNRFHDQSYEEVGATLGLTIEAVKSLLFRARQNLKERLARFVSGDGGEEDGDSRKNGETFRRRRR